MASSSSSTANVTTVVASTTVLVDLTGDVATETTVNITAPLVDLAADDESAENQEEVATAAAQIPEALQVPASPDSEDPDAVPVAPADAVAVHRAHASAVVRAGAPVTAHVYDKLVAVLDRDIPFPLTSGWEDDVVSLIGSAIDLRYGHYDIDGVYHSTNERVRITTQSLPPCPGHNRDVYNACMGYLYNDFFGENWTRHWVVGGRGIRRNFSSDDEFRASCTMRTADVFRVLWLVLDRVFVYCDAAAIDFIHRLGIWKAVPTADWDDRETEVDRVTAATGVFRLIAFATGPGGTTNDAFLLYASAVKKISITKWPQWKMPFSVHAPIMATLVADVAAVFATALRAPTQATEPLAPSTKIGKCRELYGGKGNGILTVFKQFFGYARDSVVDGVAVPVDRTIDALHAMVFLGALTSIRANILLPQDMSRLYNIMRGCTIAQCDADAVPDKAKMVAAMRSMNARNVVAFFAVNYKTNANFAPNNSGADDDDDDAGNPGDALAHNARSWFDHVLRIAERWATPRAQKKKRNDNGGNGDGDNGGNGGNKRRRKHQFFAPRDSDDEDGATEAFVPQRR